MPVGSSTLPSASELIGDAIDDPRLMQKLSEDDERQIIQRRLHDRVAAQPRIHFPADDIEVSFVRDGSKGVEFDARHEQLNISQRVVDTILHPTRAAIESLTQDIKTKGGFLLSYQGVGSERLSQCLDLSHPEQGGWVMDETSGRPVTEATAWQKGERVIGGDGHFWVPPDREITLGEIPLPIESGDVVLEGQKIIEEILADPACAVLIADICAIMPKMGFASATEDVALHEIATLNESRSHQLQYAIAAIASVKGMVDAEGNSLGAEFDPGLLNVASVILHTRAGLPGCVLGRQTNRRSPVQMQDGTWASLIVDWYITAQKLADLKRRDDVRIAQPLV